MQNINSNAILSIGKKLNWNHKENVMSKKLIPERLTKAREAKGLTKTETAKRVNLTMIGYCRYEYGDRTPSPQTLEVISKTLDTSVNYLTGESDDMASDTIYISKEHEPELFELVNELKDSDASKLKRLLSYYKKIK